MARRDDTPLKHPQGMMVTDIQEEERTSLKVSDYDEYDREEEERTSLKVSDYTTSLTMSILGSIVHTIHQ
eukprot:381120-Prorocentrum_minimum.AAC.1